MGIDIYMRWDDQTEDEKEAQYTGFSIDHGHVGYLREAYHGGPYATQVLVPEAFEADECVAEIPASILRSRLADATQTVIERSKKVYKTTITKNDPSVQSFVDFVELAEKIETKTGKPVTVIASY